MAQSFFETIETKWSVDVLLLAASNPPSAA
jgi:hypothetical protein